MAGIIHEVERTDLLEQVRQEAADAARQLAEAARLRRGHIVVVGCSTSEVVGHQVGSWSTPQIAQAIFDGLNSVFAPMGVYIAAQCCEHLNRALIVEHEAVPGAEIVNVLPQPKAGSSFATAAYQSFQHPVALEEIRADAGLDIGGTLIGMHLHDVAVPVRLSLNHIGEAILLCARTRPKSIGGERAHDLHETHARLVCCDARRRRDLARRERALLRRGRIFGKQAKANERVAHVDRQYICAPIKHRRRSFRLPSSISPT